MFGVTGLWSTARLPVFDTVVALFAPVAVTVKVKGDPTGVVVTEVVMVKVAVQLELLEPPALVNEKVAPAGNPALTFQFTVWDVPLPPLALTLYVTLDTVP
jgi:hypothetical protein